jgi:hypothetical protein
MLQLHVTSETMSQIMKIITTFEIPITRVEQ